MIEEAIKLMEEGKLIVYPTDTLYGIGANIFLRQSVLKIYEIKRRPYDMPISICLHDIDEIEKYAILNDVAEKLIEKFLPDMLTIILKKKDSIPDYISKEKVAIRIPANEIALSLAKKFPITATSANIHGGEEPRSIQIAKKQLGDAIAMYIDAGKLPGKHSTIVDLSEGKIKIIREGAIKAEELNV